MSAPTPRPYEAWRESERRDWASREVLGWSLSDNMSAQLCLGALDMAFSIGRKPEIFNTDQGSQYTSHEWLRELEERGISISMDGKGRWADNIAVERFWRTYKHDCFLLNEVNTLEEARRLTAHWLTYYNRERPHARLDNLCHIFSSIHLTNFFFASTGIRIKTICT